MPEKHICFNGVPVLGRTIRSLRSKGFFRTMPHSTDGVADKSQECTYSWCGSKADEGFDDRADPLAPNKEAEHFEDVPDPVVHTRERDSADALKAALPAQSPDTRDCQDFATETDSFNSFSVIVLLRCKGTYYYLYLLSLLWLLRLPEVPHP